MDMQKHIEEFAAAFLKHTNITDPTKVVMMKQGMFPNEQIWFREKTENEIKLNSKSETTIEDLCFCPVCPCKFCMERR